MATEGNALKRSAAEELTVNEETAKLPSKRLYRQRAHCNPWSDHRLDYPVRPDQQDWPSFYADANTPVTMVDVGCGYGGLLFHLSNSFPETRVLGLEIRLKVVDYVQVRA